jgi:hypothetical protein
VGEGRVAYRIFFVGKPERRPRRRWEDNIKMDVPVSGMGRHGLD